MNDCCHTEPENQHTHEHRKRFDFILWGSLGVIVVTQILHFILPDILTIHHFASGVTEMLGQMWWGILMGIIFVGVMGKIPREYFTAVLGRGDKMSGVFRATIAGLFLDLCSHGIVMVAAKLYERGASLAQVMAFLIASPWNSLSLTIILVSLIGFKWTLAYVFGSALIAVVSGLIFMRCVKAEILPENPNRAEELPHEFSLRKDIQTRMKSFKPELPFFIEMIKTGLKESRMLIRWLLLGVVIAATMRAFVPPDMFGHWFGPTILGLIFTLVVTTIIEVCSEGSAPIAAEIFHRAAAPGNSFTFLMAGVSTDYTEMMVIREFTKSWKIALFLPLVTVPQVLLLGYIMNVFGGG